PHDSLFNHYLSTLCLHSFPTRRSSDLLIGALGSGIPLKTIQRHIRTNDDVQWSSGPLRVNRREGPTRRNYIHRMIRKAWRLGHEDRKSTRLNSSHQIISYAVFCLNKKN